MSVCIQPTGKADAIGYQIMAKILFLNVTGSTNKGDMAFVIGHILSIKHHLPDAEITILSGDVSVDRIYQDYGAKVQPHPWYLRRKSRLLFLAHMSLGVTRDIAKRLLYGFARIFNKKCKHPYDRYDLVVDPHADGFNEPYYGFGETLYFLLFLYFARLIIRKPIIIGPASLGPLTSRVNRRLGKFLFNRVATITLREKASLEYLTKDLMIDKPEIYLIDNQAFLLECSFSERIKGILKEARGDSPDKKPLIGITPNRGMAEYNRPQDYPLLMANVVDYIIDNLDARILFIPQTSDITRVINARIASDNTISSEICSKIHNRQAATIVPDDIAPEEWKAVIGSCDLFIGCRLHCSIMSTSMSVPTVTLAYGRKVFALIGGMMGQEDTIVGINNPDYTHVLSELKAKIDYVWANRDKIREELDDKNKEVNQRALTYGELVKELIGDRKR